MAMETQPPSPINKYLQSSQRLSDLCILMQAVNIQNQVIWGVVHICDLYGQSHSQVHGGGPRVLSGDHNIIASLRLVIQKTRRSASLFTFISPCCYLEDFST